MQERHRATALGFSLEPASVAAYSSALHSYVTFCQMHNYSVEPTADTLSMYVVYMCHHIRPASVKSYLSGICSQLEGFYPTIREVRKSPLVTKTLIGCTKMRAVSTSRKRPISPDEMDSLFTAIHDSSDYDDLLFLAICMASFHGLMRLGENVWPDKKDLQDYRKVIKRTSVSVTTDAFAFTLPAHKADRLFEGNKIIIHLSNAGVNAIAAISSYLRLRDKRFPFHTPLWVRDDGSIPTRHWFMARLRLYLPLDIFGHSFRPGGATALALAGVPSHIIQAMGRWKSETFQSYIRQHPALLAALLYTSKQPPPLVNLSS